MNLRVRHKILVIKKNIEIKKILSNGKKIRTKYGVFFIEDKIKSAQLHFAVLIKRSVGNAVYRNYCKRIVRSYVRNRTDRLIENGQIIFIYTYNGKVKYDLLEEEFDKKFAFL